METKIRSALVWDPYLDTLGGGERYALTVAETLAEAGYRTVLPWKNNVIITAARDRFGLKLKELVIDPAAYELLAKPSRRETRRLLFKQFEVIFWVSDGSIPTLWGQTNLLHYQVPFTRTSGNALVNWWKLRRIKTIVVNSRFTETVIRRTLGTNNTTVIYPPVPMLKAVKKKNLILNVGRFVSPSHPKRQEVLIESFRRLVESGLKGWQLVLAGGHRGDASLLEQLKEQAGNLPIKFEFNPDYDHLVELYAQAAIYWHAAGYGVDEQRHPEAVEHFGITTVEAMSAGCVPIVFDKGGQREIVIPGTGYLVSSQEELLGLTRELVHNEEHRQKLARKAVSRAEFFSADRFKRELLRLL